jgi:hypothetical protein
VDLIGACSKRRDLADSLVSAVQQLRKAQARPSGPASSVRSAQSPRQWRVGDRLSEVDTAQLVAAFTAGTSKRKLAERYGISESSVKRLIRQHGASKPSRGLAIADMQNADGAALLQGLAEPGGCWLTGFDDMSSPTVSGRSEEMPGCSGPLRMGQPAGHMPLTVGKSAGQPPWRRFGTSRALALYSYPTIDLGRGVQPPKRAAARVRQLPPLALGSRPRSPCVALTASAWPRVHEYGLTGRYYVAVTAVDDHF